jgi:hypothetical protein
MQVGTTTRSARAALALAIVGALLAAPAVESNVNGTGGFAW